MTELFVLYGLGLLLAGVVAAFIVKAWKDTSPEE